MTPQHYTCTHLTAQLRRLPSGNWMCLGCQTVLGPATAAWLGLEVRR